MERGADPRRCLTPLSTITRLNLAPGSLHRNTVQLLAEPHSCYSSHRCCWSDLQQQAGLLLSLRHTACETPSRSAGLVFWKWTAVLAENQILHQNEFRALVLPVTNAFAGAFQNYFLKHTCCSKYHINKILLVSHF